MWTLFYHLHRSYSNIVINGEGCVAMATTFEENSLLSYWGVEGRTINCHLKSGAVWTIFHWLKTTLCFMARDTLETWKRHMMTSHNWRTAVEGQNISHHMKYGAVWTIFIGVTATPCIMARDALPWKRHTVRSHISRIFQGRSVNHHVKFGGVLSMSVGVMTSSCSMARDRLASSERELWRKITVTPCERKRLPW